VTRTPARDEVPEPHHRQPIDPDVEADDEDRRLGHTATVRREVRAVLAERGDVLVAVAAGGAVGSLGRWGLGEGLAGSGPFPWATFVENVTGGFALGLLVVVLLAAWPGSRYLRPFLGVGVLGGYTTFSTFSQEIFSLLESNDIAVALTYAAASVGVGLLAVYAGTLLGRSF
jgi:fluoride exporter